MIDNTVVHNHILSRNTSVAARFVLAGLHADSIVAYVERTMADNHVAARLNIDTVAVLAIPRITNRQIAHYDVLAAHRVEVPCRRILESNTLEQDTMTTHEMKHHRAQEGFNYLPE